MASGAVAWVFPGQGAQEAGMGRDLYEASQAARDLFDRADAALGRSISRLCFDGPPAELNQTANAQPAIYVTSLACLAAAREAGTSVDAPSFVAGHSMGEYTALAAAGALDFDAGLRLVEQRGRLTQAAADARPGAMAALLGLDADKAAEVAREAAQGDVCDFANDNAPGQVVVSGAKAAVERALEIAKAKGGKRAILLPVSAPFHCALMKPAADVMQDALAAVTIAPPRVPLVANVTAQAVSDPETIRKLLVQQVTGLVRWRECVLFLKQKGLTTLVEIGSGKVLTGLVRRIDPDLTGVSIQGPADIEAFIKTL